ncbi:PepSY-associated TM helix domain-containing protein [Sphingomonas sp.]|uniref:PepSY-associated TM helix domain-containing protein n=1 Tax=Sphingomonas sp. TaxID=28214 RepID=UPI003AFFAD78
MTKVKWRRTWFSVHKWIGLILAIAILPLCVSGAALVYGHALDRAVNPQRYATSGEALLTPDRYVAAAQARSRPGERIAQLSYPDEGGAVTVALSPAPKPGEAAGPPRAGPPQRTVVYLDPPTARVLEVAASGGGLVRFFHVLHGSLQIPGGWGRSIVGWIGVAMMVSAFTGLWLWWPTVGSLKRGLRWGRHRNVDTNLHQTFGFWIALPLFVLSLTGAWISFPQFFGGLVGEGRPRGPDRMAQARARPVEAARLSAGAAIDRARALTAGTVRQVTWPTEKKPDWSVQLRPQRGAPVTVSVADDDGVAAVAPAMGGQGGVGRFMRQLHEGEIGGTVWAAIVFLGGLIPAMLAVTGIVMWWRARGWKAQLAARQRARAA